MSDAFELMLQTSSRTDLPSWQELGLLLVLSASFVTVGALGWGLALRRLYRFFKFHRGRSKLATAVEDNLGYAHMFTVAAAFIVTAALVILVLGRSFVLEGLALGSAIALFIAVYLPTLFPPTVELYMEMPDANGFPDGNPVRQPTLQPNSRTLIYFYFTNLGTNYYKSCTCWVSFDRAINVVVEEEAYASAAYRKLFEWHPSTHAACFLATLAHMDVPAGGTLCLPLIIEAPAGTYTNQFRISSETRWGIRRIGFTITVSG